jgi:hypothetical protein
VVGVISEPGLDALGVAATLTHCLPALHLRLRTPEGRPLLDVVAGGDPIDRSDPMCGAGLSLSPCAFRQQVIRARHRVAGGQRLGFLALDGDPAIEVGLPRGGRTFPGGIHRVPIGERWIYAFGVSGVQEAYVGAGRPVVDAWPGPVPDQLGLRADTELGTVVCYAEAAPGFGGEDGLVDLLGSLLAVFTAESVCGAASASLARRSRP